MRDANEILEEALGFPADSQERWDLIVSLHKRGDAATFQAASDLAGSSDPARRVLGVDVLAQLGAHPNEPAREQAFREPTAELLLNRLTTEQELEVLESIAVAFGHLRDPRSIPALYALRNHPDAGVRSGVVAGLRESEDDLAVEALIDLSADVDAHIRDWATFGMGTLISRDDPKIRDALLAWLEDPDTETRAEAIRGLARRGDDRAIPQLLHELREVQHRDDPLPIEEALLALASKTADARLCEFVRDMCEVWRRDNPDEPMHDDLAAAVVACGGTSASTTPPTPPL